MEKMIRVSEGEYDLLMKARNEVVNRGLNELKAKGGLFKQRIPSEVDLTRGAIVGLAALALIYLLTKE